MLNTCSLYCAATTERRDLDNFLWTVGSPNGHPVINRSGDEMYEIIIEGVVVCRCGDIVTAFGLIMAAYYIFNLEYPAKIENTLTFYQRIFLGVIDSSKNARVSALTCKLLS